MKTLFKRIALVFSLSLVLFFSCTKDEAENIITTETSTEAVLEAPKTIQDPNKQVYNYIISLGFSGDEITEVADSYRVEGDILFAKDMIVPKEKDGKSEEGLTHQLYSGSLVSYSRRRDIKVWVNPNMNIQLAEINAAIALWNNADSHIHFRRVTSGAYDVRIERNDNIGAGTCADAYTPSGGKPGNRIRVNVPLVAGDNFAQRTINIAHEMGHTIGFMHTNGLSNTGPTFDVPGWAGGDGASIMNGQRCHQLATVLSARDIGALRTLYPQPHPKPSNVRIETAYNTFKISWTNSCTACNHAAINHRVSYSGNVSNNPYFNGNVSVHKSATSYTVPNATPNPSVNGNYIYASVRSTCAHGTYYGGSVGKNKSGGVWR